MKRVYILLLLLIACQLQAQVGIQTTSPDAQLDVRSSNQAAPANTDGILIPKVDAFPATNPTAAQQGMLVYLNTPTTFLATTRLPGFYYWDNTIPDWIGISTSTNGDHDWYEEGTTTPPNAITDDMFHTGNVAIGKNTADYPLEVTTTNFDKGINTSFTSTTNNGNTKFAMDNAISGTSTDVQNAIRNTISSSGVGNNYGIRNNMTGTGAGLHIGTFNDILNGTGAFWGTYNRLVSTTLSQHYGVNNDISGGDGANVGVKNLIYGTNTIYDRGVENVLNGSGDAVQTATHNEIGNYGDGVHYGTYNDLNNVGDGNQYGTYTSLTNTGGGIHYGNYNILSGNGTISGNQYGVVNEISKIGNSNHYGVKNILSGGGNGVHYGNHNELSGAGTGINYGNYNNLIGTGSGDHIANLNNLTGNGIGAKIGIRSFITSTNTVGIYGINNIINGGGTSANYGGYNTLFGNSSGNQTGTYNEISNTGGGDHYGTRNTMSGIGIGIKYGTQNFISPTAGGTHYGVYSEVLKAGATNFAGYFLGNVGVGTTTANTYKLPPSRGTNLQIMQTDGVGNVTWQNPSVVQDSDWYKVATTLAPTAITDDMFHTGRVGIGTVTPNFTLDVASTGRAINATTSGATTTGMIGFNTAVAGASAGHGVVGQTNQSGGQGIRGEQLNAFGYGASGINFGASGASGGGGVYAQTTQSNGFATDSRNFNVNGTGVFAIGNNIGGSYLIAGSGGAFNGTVTGAYVRSTTAGIGEGLYTEQFGVVTRVNYWSGALQYKIIGTGTVSTTAEDLNGERVTLHCPETPEILFEDYGQGQLVNGTAHIKIDPIIAKNIVVNERHPLRVYIQLEDDCNGVFVSNKTGNSFDVTELASGHSNAKFQYHIIGNRADELLPNGRLSKNADARFEPAPKNSETKEATLVNIGKPTTQN